MTGDDPLIGTTIDGHIDVLRLIGRGGMGAVYEGFHQRLGTPVAIKVLISQMSAGQETIRRFQAEARTAGSLKHPNIVTTHSFGLLPDIGPYIVMELLSGISLGDYLEEHKRLDKSSFENIFQQCCAGFAEAHDKGFVHRDIKPSNIMLVKQDDGSICVKITDFGIAKFFGQQDIQSLTRTGEILGTPMYMSPEQCEGRSIDPRSDIYSLGCVMYEALAGSPPFSSETPLDVMMKHVSEPPQSPTERNKDLVPLRPLVDAVMHSLQKDPNGRPQTMRVLADELKDAGRGVSHFVRKNRSLFVPLRVVAAVVGVLLVIAAACFVAYFVQPRKFTTGSRPSVFRPNEISNYMNDTSEAADKALQEKIDPVISYAEKYGAQAVARDLESIALWKEHYGDYVNQLHPENPQEENGNYVVVTTAYSQALRAHRLLIKAGMGVRGASDVAAKLAAKQRDDQRLAIEALRTDAWRDDNWKAKAFFINHQYKEAYDLAHDKLQGENQIWIYSRAGQGLIRKYEESGDIDSANQIVFDVIDAAHNPVQSDQKIFFETASEMAALDAEKGNIETARKLLDRFHSVELDVKKKDLRAFIRAVGAYASALVAKHDGNPGPAVEQMEHAKSLMRSIKHPNEHMKFWQDKILPASI